MSGMTERSPRAESARTVFLYGLGIAGIINALFVQILGMDSLDHGWWLVPRYALTAVTACAGLVWAWETYKRHRDGGVTYYSGSLGNVPTDLDAIASDREDATCHVCDKPADVVLQVLDEEANLGGAIFLCAQDAALVSRSDIDALSQRLAVNYERLPSEMTKTASSMVHGTGRSVRLAGR
jgi:hypothetical protein